MAIISPAGDTGINLQDLGTGRRFYIALDLDWDAKKFKQSSGPHRPHRAGERRRGRPPSTRPSPASASSRPRSRRRMKAMGAISKGQEDAGNTDELDAYDMESSTWLRAINETLRNQLPSGQNVSRQTLGKMPRAGSILLDPNEEITPQQFQNDLMLLPHKVGNEIFDAAYERWAELEEEDRQNVGDRIARRNRGLIRKTVELDEGRSSPAHPHRRERQRRDLRDSPGQAADPARRRRSTCRRSSRRSSTASGRPARCG